MGTKLTATRVYEVFLACLYKEGEDTSNHVKAEGITCLVGFNPDRLEEHRAEISEMLDELPEEFKEGWSFLNACVDKNDRQWGEHKNVEQLFQLGIAIGRVKCLMPREIWAMLPGGMPYYTVLEEEYGK